MISVVWAIVIAVVTAGIGIAVGYFYRKSYTEKKIGRTEEYARRLYDDAVRKRKIIKRKRCWRPRRKF